MTSDSSAEDDSANLASFSRSANYEPGSAPVGVDVAHRVAAKFAAAFPGAPNPVIVDSFHDLPDAVKREASEQSISDKGKGGVHNAFSMLRGKL